jgi:hypothetical protein
VADLIYVAVIIAFFALASLFVVACDRIIGADDSAVTGTREPAPEPAPLDEVAA